MVLTDFVVPYAGTNRRDRREGTEGRGEPGHVSRRSQGSPPETGKDAAACASSGFSAVVKRFIPQNLLEPEAAKDNTKTIAEQLAQCV